MIAQSPPHIPIGVRPSPLIPLSSSSSSSFPRAPFLTKIYSSVHERSRPFMELEHLPPLLPLLNRARPLTGPDARGDRPGHRNLVAVPSFTSETEAWLDRIQPFRSRSFRRPDAGNACKRMDQDPERGVAVVESFVQVLREIRRRPEAKTRWSRASVGLGPPPLR